MGEISVEIGPAAVEALDWGSPDADEQQQNIQQQPERIDEGKLVWTDALVAGLDDAAVVGEAIERRRGHLGVAEDCGPLAEGEVVVTITKVGL